MIEVVPKGQLLASPVQTASPIDVADLLVAYLRQLGIEYVFGVPGGAIEPLYNALARSAREGGPEVITARHETGAAFMAYGYYMGKKRLGVCCSTTGPGATNMITGVATAYENSTPMLVITAQTALSSFGKGAFQESSDTSMDILGMFQYCTKYNSLVSHAEQFEQKLYSAIMSAYHHSAPVHLSIPMDIFRCAASSQQPSYDLTPLLSSNDFIDNDMLLAFIQELESAKNIVLVIGEGCIDAIGTILAIAFMLQAKIVTTPHGKGLVSPYHPLFRGVVGFAGHQSAIKQLADPDVDLVVAIGSNLSEWASNNWSKELLMNNKLVHVESVQSNFTRSPMAKLHVHGNINSIFEKVIAALFSQSNTAVIQQQVQQQIHIEYDAANRFSRHFILDDEHKCRDDSTPIKPQRLMYELTEIFPPQTCYLADVGNSFSWTVHYLHPHDRRMAGKRQRGYGVFHSCFEFAPMGWAIGAAVGMAMSRPNIPIVCITGDGSWLMNGQEITVALQRNLNIIFIILNDSALGMVKHGQQLNNAEQVGHQLPDVNFAAMAAAMGIDAFIIESPDDLLKLDMAAINKKSGPVLLDVRIDAREIPPIKSRINVLAA